MAVIVERENTKKECIIAFPYGQVEEVQINTGRYRWNLDLENGRVSMYDLLVNADKKDVREIRRALTQFEEYLTDKEKEDVSI